MPKHRQAAIEALILVHLSSHELEARDLTFSLSVGPGRSDSRPNRCFIFRDAAGERGNKTGPGTPNPSDKSRFNLAPDHQVEFGNDLACLDQGWHASFDGRDRDSLRFRKQVSPDRHQARDRSGRRDSLKVLCVGPFGPSSAGFADRGGPTMFARVGVMRALNRHVERVFDSSRKEKHWGKRKLARDR
jgi:hypothetical protein